MKTTKSTGSKYNPNNFQLSLSLLLTNSLSLTLAGFPIFLL